MQAFSQQFENVSQDGSLCNRSINFESSDISHEDNLTTNFPGYDNGFYIGTSQFDTMSQMSSFDLPGAFSKQLTDPVIGSECMPNTNGDIIIGNKPLDTVSSGISSGMSSTISVGTSATPASSSSLMSGSTSSSLVSNEHNNGINDPNSSLIFNNSGPNVENHFVVRNGRKHSEVSPLTASSPYTNVAVNRASKTKFTEEDDSLIIELKEHRKLTWKDISEHFNGRTPGALQVRYCTKLKARVSWCEEDMVALKSAVNEYESQKWIAIAEKLGNKYSPIMCKKKHGELAAENSMFVVEDKEGRGDEEESDVIVEEDDKEEQEGVNLIHNLKGENNEHQSSTVQSFHWYDELEGLYKEDKTLK